MPTLAAAIVKDGGVPNFRGFMVGNPLTYMPYRDYGEVATYYGHQLIAKPLWDKYIAGNCSYNCGTGCGRGPSPVSHTSPLRQRALGSLIMRLVNVTGVRPHHC